MPCIHTSRTSTTTGTFTFSTRAGDVRRKIELAPLLHATDFFKLHVVAHETRSTFGVNKDFENEDDKFLLDDEKWRKLQLYVKTSQRLPTTQQSLEVQFGDKITEALSAPVVIFLIDVYTTIAGNCGAFQRDYYQVVSLANDVVSYGKDTETYYPKISELFDIVVHGTNEEAQQQAATHLRAIFSGLSDRTEAHASKVQDTFQFIQRFNEATGKDQTQVSVMTERVAGQDSATTTEIARIEKDIKDKREELEKFNDAYEDALQKGKNTAAYIWIPIVGWIAGPIVSAQASAEARAAWTEIRRLDKELKDLDNDLGHAKRLKQTVGLFNTQVSDVSTKIKDALDTLGIMSAAWFRMSDDFKEIAEKLIKWQEHTDILAQLDFIAQQKKWAEIRKLADDYVARAFVDATDATRYHMNFDI